MIAPRITRKTRLLLVAPHPDDEALACGIILQRAVRAGAAIRVVYATDGDNNPWPQRALERKWRLGERDRERWGRLRRIEARAALHVLGVGRRQAHFLGLPDQGLTQLLMDGSEATLALFREAITAWKPTLLLVPSISDSHADHNAIGVMLALLQEGLHAQLRELTTLSYQVHGRCAASSHGAVVLPQSRREAAAKRLAIACHRTQTALSRRRFLAYAARPETFRQVSPSEASASRALIRSSARDANHLRLRLRFSLRAFAAAEPRLVLIGRSASSGGVECVTVRLPAHPAEVALVNQHSGEEVALMSYRGNGFAGYATIPTTQFASSAPLFVKVDRGGLRAHDQWVKFNALPVAQPPMRELTAPRITRRALLLTK